MSTSTISISKAVKAGAIAGIAGAVLNNIWLFIAGSMGVTIPPSFAIAVSISSVLPVVIGSVIFFLLMKFSAKGLNIWYAIAGIFTLISFYPVFNTPQLPDGTITDSTFPVLIGPMHLISGLLALWGIPKWSK